MDNEAQYKNQIALPTQKTPVPQWAKGDRQEKSKNVWLFGVILGPGDGQWRRKGAGGQCPPGAPSGGGGQKRPKKTFLSATH